MTLACSGDTSTPAGVFFKLVENVPLVCSVVFILSMLVLTRAMPAIGRDAGEAVGKGIAGLTTALTPASGKTNFRHKLRFWSWLRVSSE